MKRFCRFFVFLIVLSCWIPHLAAAQVVNMPDENLAALVRDELNLAPDAPITRQALRGLHHLDDYRAPNLKRESAIKDLTGLEHATNLQGAFLIYHDISDLGPLEGLTQLRRLWIGGNPINDFSPLAGLKQLRILSVSVRSEASMNTLRRLVDNLTQLELLQIDGHRSVGQRIEDLPPLGNLTQLKHFQFSSVQIDDVTPLAGLTQLEHLDLGNNEIGNVTPLAGLTQLESLLLVYNEIRDVTPLAGLTQLRSLGLSLNEIGDVTPLAGLTQLKTLDLNDNEIGDVTPLAGLTQLKRLNLSNNQVTDVTAIQHLIDSPSTQVLLDGNPIDEQPEDGADLVVTTVKVAKKGTSPHASKDWKDTLDVSPGDAFDLRVIVLNSGKRAAEATRVKFYRSTDAEISEDDTELPAKKNNRRHPPGTTYTHIVTFQLPAAGGVYYYGAKVEPVESENDTDNNWSVGVKVGKEELEPPPNLISDVAFTKNSTYFIVNTQLPKLLIANQDVTYGTCLITLDLPGVPAEPLTTWDWDSADLWPPYFMWELLSPRQRIDALAGKYDLDATEVVIGGITTAIGLGVGQTVAPKVLPFIPLGPIARQTDKIAPGLIKIGSKFKVLIPRSKRAALLSKEGIAEKGRFVISKGIGALADSGTEFGAGYLIGRVVKTVFTAGPEKEPTIEEELLANTADPKLTVVPISGGNTPLPKESRHLCRIPGAVGDIGIKIEQVYFRKNNKGQNVAFTAVYEGRRDLGNAGAPGIRAMSVADYPPFQYLPPEIQDYLRRDFGAFLSVETRQVPETTALLPNYPNPFNPETWIPYQLAKPAEVSLTIYDIHGRVVRTLDVGHQRAETYQGRSRAAYWDGKNAVGEPVASGVYFYTLKAGDFSATRKMLIRK